MDILSLRYFIAAAEYRSFSKAAEHSYTSQPNISKHIQRLEKELKVQLFIRKGKNIELTDVGLKCLSEIRDIVEKVDILKIKANKYRLGEYGELRIGYTGEFEYKKFSETINRFGSKHSNVNILFARKSQSEVLNELLEDNLDVILTLSTGLNKIENICYREIAKNKLVLIVPYGHKFANYNFIKKEDLCE